MTEIGFTGARAGMTAAQKLAFLELLPSLRNGELVLRHGDCVGADADAHDLAASLGSQIIIHPGIASDGVMHFRAWKNGAAVSFREPKLYLERDRDIVDLSDLVIATPAGPPQVRSGTWYTIRYARKRRKALYIIEPDGTVAF